MKIPFNDGEALEHADLNLQRDLYLRLIYDLLGMNLAGPDSVNWAQAWLNEPTGTDQLRPLRNAGGVVLFSGNPTAVDIRGGLFLQADFSAALGPDGPSALIGHADTITNLTGFVASASATYRRDIIQARVVSADEATVSRDFKDAVTGALSSQSFVKRNNVTVEFARKAGAVEYALQSDADNPANEQTADAGWYKIGSLLCSDLGLVDYIDNYWDWRKPWGFASAFSQAGDFWWDYLKTFRQVVAVTTAINYIDNDADVLYMDCPFGKRFPSSVQKGTVHPYRLHRVAFGNDFQTNMAAGDLELWQRDPQVGLQTLHSQVGGNVTSGASGAQSIIYLSTTSVKPLWSSGRTHPFFSQNDLLTLKFTTASPLDQLWNVHFDAWGGF